ncbi:MAG TPA: HDIG domain-containing protein [Anaerolineae bacterium]|nr:HDIG domain-containing protein [Anaerolineae bacterium]HQH39181.1 HDIG domain-containing protein [Anaerolineae bacterium]
MVTWRRAWYRSAQFFTTLWTSWRPVDIAYAARHLDHELLRLFQRMARAEQHHGIAVCRTLEAQGHTDPDLLIAALLHDVGKIKAPPRLWDRVGAVLGERFAPQWAARWSRGEPRGLRRGFVIRRQHPAWGAALAGQAGASPRAVDFIRRHHDPVADDKALAALQAADGK